MACYVSFGVLGFLLLGLSPAFAVEVKNLKNIINHLHNTYGFDTQYALGISVPVNFCNQDASLDQNFLPRDDATYVRNTMKSKEDPVYTGFRLIGARPKFPKKQVHFHAEYLLLRSTDPSYMQDLLNKPDGGCTVFFSMSSPCVKYCSTPTGPRSIIPGLEMFKNYNGPKAFVFREIYRLDDPTDWEHNLHEVNQRIPVYRCQTNGCVRCVRNDNTVDPQCKEK